MDTASSNETTIFTVRPHRGGWQCLEGPGVAPYFTKAEGRRQAIDYAKGRTAHRHGEIRVFNAAGEFAVFAMASRYRF